MRAPFAFSRSMRARRSRHSLPEPPPNANVMATPVSRDAVASISISRSHTARSLPAAPGMIVL